MDLITKFKLNPDIVEYELSKKTVKEINEFIYSTRIGGLSRLKQEKIELLVKHFISYNKSNIRVVEKFLWKPKTINGKTKWLTYVQWYEEGTEIADYFATMILPTGGLLYKTIWRPLCWVEQNL